MKFMDILDQYGAVLVKQEMIQPVVEDEDLDCPVVDYPPELAAPPEPALDCATCELALQSLSTVERRRHGV